MSELITGGLSSFYGGKQKRQWSKLQAAVDEQVKKQRIEKIPETFKQTILGPSVKWKTFFRQQDAFLYARSQAADLHVFAFESEILGSESGQRQYLVTSYPVFWHYYRQLKKSSRHHYEVIPENSVCKLYFDLEFLKEYNPGRDGNHMVEVFIKYVNYWLQQKFGISCDRRRILDLEASTDRKFSRHLLYLIPGVAFRDNIHAGNFVHFMAGELRKHCNGNDKENLLLENETFMYGQGHKEETKELPEGVTTPNLEDIEALRLGKGHTQVRHGKGHTEKKRELPEGVTTTELESLMVKNKEGEDVWFCDLGVYTKNRNFRLYLSRKLGKDNPLVLSSDNLYNPTPTRQRSTEGPNQGTRQRSTEGPNQGTRQRSTESPSQSSRQRQTEGPSQNTSCRLTEGPSQNTSCRLTEGPNQNTSCRLTEGPNQNTSCRLTEGPNQNTSCRLTEDQSDKDKHIFMDSLVANVQYQPDTRILSFDSERIQSRSSVGHQKDDRQEIADTLDGHHHSPYPELDKYITSYVQRNGTKGQIRHWTYFSEGEIIVYEICRNRWCENIGRPHKSNNIMLIADLKKAVYYQKCHDPVCKMQNFKSPDYPLPREVLPSSFFDESEIDLEGEVDDQECLKAVIDMESSLTDVTEVNSWTGQKSEMISYVSPCVNRSTNDSSVVYKPGPARMTHNAMDQNKKTGGTPERCVVTLNADDTDDSGVCGISTTTNNTIGSQDDEDCWDGDDDLLTAINV
ncbi:DNA-directed primase/polymerase protein-like [Ylistrum balloti]|uniref:DNA-directed primase/polymerase protein-like n=1 Tax=Ylistrum balloti TaxID=509963 RepID=UPI002905A250|nr:DNA-directed primase/polymerase protein-like [Ylistrum balloti]